MTHLMLSPLEDRLAPALINFALTTPTSSYTLSGTVDGNKISQQGAGSLTTTYTGNVAVDLDFSGNTIEFLSAGSAMKANNSGTWTPAVGGGSAFSAGKFAANYGGLVTVTLPTTVAARNLVSAFSSSPLPLTGGVSFPSTQLLTLTAGTIDYNNFGLQGTGNLGGSGLNAATAKGTFTDLGNGNYTLVMPGNSTINDSSSGFALILNVLGTFNATATLPVVDLNGAASGFDAAFSQTAGGAASKIAPAATITRAPTANLASLSVTLGATPDGLAESLAVDLTGTTLTTTGFDSGTGKLTITGSGTPAIYQSVLQKVTYTNSNAMGTAGPRGVSVTVTDASNASLMRTSTGTVSLPATAAKIASMQVNDNSVQRSRVTSLRVAFDSPVTLAGTAFQLARQGDNAAVNLSAAIDNSGPGTVATLTFTGGAVDFGSLADGRYTLTVLASQVNAGNFDGDGNGTAGDNFVLVGNPATNKLFRLFGDADGNGTVDGNDFSTFGSSVGTSFAGPGYNDAFNFNADTTIDGGDFAEFGNRFGRTL